MQLHSKQFKIIRHRLLLSSNTCLLLLSLLTLTSTSYAQTGIQHANALQAHLTFLSDDLLQGREPGNPGYDIAAAYVASHYQALGLKPAGDDESYFQSVPLHTSKRDLSAAKMTLSRDGQHIDFIQGDDFIVSAQPLYANNEITAPVVFAGFGVQAPAFGIDDYAGLDVEGKIVAVFLGGPKSLPGEERAHYGNGATKAQVAAAHGAIGLISFHTIAFDAVFPYERIASRGNRTSMTWVQNDGAAYVPAAEIQTGALISKKTAEQLFTGSKHSFADLRKQADTDTGSVAGFELDARLTIAQATQHAQIQSANVAAMIEGSDPILKNEVIVFSAHLDHDGIGREVDGDKIYNGAFDNASGTAVIMEVARALQANPPRRSVMFLSVTAEEKGLIGAQYFAHNPTVKKSNIVANINVDGVLMSYDFTDLIVFGAGHSSLGEVAEKVAIDYGLTLADDPFVDQGFFTRSDHYRFVQQGIPSIFPIIGVGETTDGESGLTYFQNYLNNHYHQPSDDMQQTFDFNAGAKFVRIMADIAKHVGNAEQRPTWNEGDFFGDLFVDS